jgi:hypothetical protein
MHDSLLLCPHLLVIAARALFISALVLFAPSVTYILYVLILGRVRAHRSPLRNLPGPEKAHWLSGDFVDVQENDSSRLQEEWVTTYGHVMKYHSRFGVRSYSFHSIRGADLVQRMTILPLADA